MIMLNSKKLSKDIYNYKNNNQINNNNNHNKQEQEHTL